MLVLSPKHNFIGTIVAQLPKLHRGEHFENLGMITSLLSKKPAKDLRSVGASPRIEAVPSSEAGAAELGDGGGDGQGEGEGESEEESDEFDWQVEQELPKDQDLVRVVSGYSVQNTSI
jgi:hypothetical protein